MVTRFFVPIRLAAGIILTLTLASSSLASSQLYEDVEILSSDDNGISFVLNVETAEKYLTPYVNDTTCTFAKTVLIGVPPDARPSITDARGFEPTTLDYRPENIVLVSSNTLAEIVQLKQVRGRFMISVNVYPYYQGRFYGKVEVSIDFGRTPSLAGEYRTDRLFDNIYKNAVLNYNQFRLWPVASKISTARTAQSPFSKADVWYKISTVGGGLIKVSGQTLIASGISISNLESDSIHLFYGGGELLPRFNDDPLPNLDEAAIMVDDGGDGKFDISDYFLFFAEAADGWRYAEDTSPVYNENPYTGQNCYWLALSGDFEESGKRMTAVDGTVGGGADTIITSGYFNIHVGQNNVLSQDSEDRIRDYYHWYWTDNAQFTFYESIANALPGEPVNVIIRALSNPNNYLFVNNVIATRDSTSRPFYYFTTDRLESGLNKFFVLLDSSTYVKSYFDYCEISYVGDLTPNNNILDFTVGGFDGTAEVFINNDFSSEPTVFDLSDINNPVIIDNPSISSSEISFLYNLSPGGPGRFYVCPLLAASEPLAIDGVVIEDIRENIAQTDLFVIAPEEFIPYLEDYEEYREGKSNINIRLVPFEQILYQFSYGLYDPLAIREFLKYAYENYPAPAPSVALLIGDGSYDFENHLGTTVTNLIPPCVHALDSSSSDDNYVFFGEFGLLDSDTSYSGDRGYDMMIARWPVNSLSELETIVEKIKSYESSTTYGPWRSTITLVADDEFGHYETEWFHTTQTEELQTPPRLPASFRRNKIYLWDYPFNSLRKKPEVNEAIVRSINDGTLMVNFVGHGNPDSWAHESVFSRNSDIPKLHNMDKLTLVLTASCSIGFFDDPQRQGMAEELLRYADGGAIGVISATRLVYSSDNAAFNQQIFEILFGSNDISITEAFFTAKLLRQYSGGSPQPIRNDRNYTYFGDPFVRLGVPHYEIKFTETPDSLLALNQHFVSGEIINPSDNSHVDIGGTIELFVYDSEIQKKHKVVNSSGDSVKTVEYSLDGPVIFRGEEEVIDGYFDFTFISPLDISYGGKTAKISAYAASDIADALGLTDSIPIGLKVIAATDSVGPEITYAFGDRNSFISGDIITSGETMTLSITDSSGINLTGSLGHGITLTIDNRVENMVNLTDLFQYEPGSYSSGSLDYEIGELDAGKHTFKVKAWDNANNSTVAEFEASIIDDGRFMVTDVLNYPNPMSSATVFSLSLSSPASQVELEIFTLSGKKIKNVMLNNIPSGYNEIYSWDGCDADMDRVATGVYVYKVTAISEWYDNIVESYGKVVVIN